MDVPGYRQNADHSSCFVAFRKVANFKMPFPPDGRQHRLEDLGQALLKSSRNGAFQGPVEVRAGSIGQFLGGLAKKVLHRDTELDGMGRAHVEVTKLSIEATNKVG